MNLINNTLKNRKFPAELYLKSLMGKCVCAHVRRARARWAGAACNVSTVLQHQSQHRRRLAARKPYTLNPKLP